MATTDTVGATTLRDGRRETQRTTAALFVAGGLLMAAGGQMHPRGSGATLEAHLLTMLQSPAWPVAHAVLLIGGVASALAFLVAWRTEAFGPQVQRWLPLAVAGWALGAAEMVPHLLAVNDAHALAHHEATPVLDAHLLMQVIATPAVGVTGAVVAVAVARAARTRAASALAAFAVVGGLLSAGAGPLVMATGDTRFAVLFPFQAGLAVWLLGTGIRLWRR